MPLANHFAEKIGQRNNRHILRISAQATELLCAYVWPGNIRELENVIERAVLLAGPPGVIEAAHLPPALQNPSIQAPPAGAALEEALEALEQRLMRDALREQRGNMSKAAAQLGVTERIMGLRMKKYAIHFKEFRGKEPPAHEA
jgi:Nif-specific regulatory protein